MAAGRAAGRHIGPMGGSDGRKVRAPQDVAMGNTHRPQGQGKCNRKQTAVRKRAFGASSRMAAAR